MLLILYSVDCTIDIDWQPRHANPSPPLPSLRDNCALFSQGKCCTPEILRPIKAKDRSCRTTLLRNGPGWSFREGQAGQNRFDEAESLLLDGYAGLDAALPPGRRPQKLLPAIERLVQLYESWGKPDKALPDRNPFHNDSRAESVRPPDGHIC